MARLFVTGKDTKVTLQPTNSSASFTAKVTHDTSVIDKQELPSLKNSNVTSLSSVNYDSVKADFNGDGVEEVIAIGWSESFADTKPFDAEYGFHFALIKAKDTLDISQGIQISKIYEPFPGVYTYLAPAYGRPVVGDLTGDGNLEIAYAAKEAIKLVTICSGNDLEESSSCFEQPEFTVVRQKDVTLPNYRSERMNASYDLNIGNFHGTGNELAVINNVQSSAGEWFMYANAFSFDIDANASRITEQDITSFNTGGYPDRGGYCFADTAKRAIHDIQEQLWVACQNYLIDEDKSDVGPMISVYQLTLNDTGTGVTRKSHLNSWNTGYWRLRGLASMFPGELSSNPQGDDFYKDLALMMADAGNMESVGVKLKTYRLNLNDQEGIFPYEASYSKEFADNYTSGTMRKLFFRPYMLTSERAIGMSQRRAKNMLYKGDLSGKSVKLGTPSYIQTPKITQPSLILGAPPAHIDYLTPVKGEKTLFNMSLGHIDHNAIFSQTSIETDGYNSQTIDTLTNGVSAQFSAEASAHHIVVPVQASFKATVGGGYVNTQVTNTSDGDSGSVTRAIDEQSGLDDKLILESQSIEYFFYPVIGGLECPGESACTDDEKVQQYLIYSRPSSPAKLKVDANLAAWYQPVHEVNNILSYPRSLEQLESYYGSPIRALTEVNDAYSTGSGGGKWNVTWSNGTSDSDETTTIDKGTWNLGFSGSYGTSESYAKLTGTAYKNSFDLKYDGSFTNKGVTTNVSSYDANMTVGVNRPITFKTPTYYSYQITPVVFGDAVDGQDINTSDPLMADEVRQAVNANSGSLVMGRLKLGYFVDIDASTVGSWWQAREHYTGIDISLNNPTRWDYDLSMTRLNPEDTNCLGSYFTYTCYFPHAPREQGYEHASAFHNMKGLFVTSSHSDELRVMAEVGEQIKLRARIYNYSQLDMPTNSRVKVQFYRQSIDSNHESGSILLSQDSAELIGEDLLPPIAGANATIKDNWDMAEVLWDIEGSDIGSYYFWVVAWPEDTSGIMLAEQEHKGLVTTDTSPTYSDINDVTLEYVTLEDNNVYSFTNNVGMYQQAFKVLSQSEVEALAATSVTSESSVSSSASAAMVADTPLYYDPNAVPTELVSSPNNIAVTLEPSQQGSSVDVKVSLNADYNTQGLMIYLEADGQVVSIKQLPNFKEKTILLSFIPTSCDENIPLSVYLGGVGDNSVGNATSSVYMSCN